MTMNQSQGLNWGRILSGLGQGLMQAGTPGGNFGQGLMQGTQFYDQGTDRKRQQELDELRVKTIQQQMEEQRNANTRAAEQDRLRQQFIANLPPGPMEQGINTASGPMQPGFDMRGFLNAFPDQAPDLIRRQYLPEATQPKTTDDLTEYAFYRSQGGADDFTSWMRGNKRAGASNSNVTVNAPKSLLAGDNKTMELGAEANAQAQEILPLFGIAREAAKNFDQSGPLGGVALFTQRMKNYMGYPNNAKDGEVLQAMQTRLGTLLRVPGSGATSNFEMALYMQGVPGLLNSQQGNIALANIGEKLIKRRMENYEALQRYVLENGTTVGFQPNDEPVLTPEDTAILQGASSSVQSQEDEGAPTATGPNGEKLILRNGQWEPM